MGEHGARSCVENCEEPALGERVRRAAHAEHGRRDVFDRATVDVVPNLVAGEPEIGELRPPEETVLSGREVLKLSEMHRTIKPGGCDSGPPPGNW